jgi:hypothetical protein
LKSSSGDEHFVLCAPSLSPCSVQNSHGVPTVVVAIGSSSGGSNNNQSNNVNTSPRRIALSTASRMSTSRTCGNGTPLNYFVHLLRIMIAGASTGGKSRRYGWRVTRPLWPFKPS